jgi:hypothetical protein
VLFAVAGVLGASVILNQAVGAEPIPGSQGTDTSLPLTDSAVTVSGRAEFADLKVTVNQTKNLTNQAVSITWEGGTPTRRGPNRFAAHYLQIMQCWGDDDGTNPENPGPPPEQCVFGGILSTFPPTAVYPNGLAISREIGRSDWQNFDELVDSGGVFDPRSTSVWLPFRAVDGTEVEIPVDPTFIPGDGGGNYWLNPYFNGITTNEIPGALTGLDGRGAEIMRLDTGVQSSGLGCGQQVQPTSAGGRKVPDCWIVVVPRGLPVDENVGSPFGVNADQFGVYTSPLYPEAWESRIAIPIEFNPVDSPCSLADDERRLAGSELVLPAISSWQPTLCASAGLPPYSYASVGDGAARSQLARGGIGSPGMVVVSRPLAADSLAEGNPVVYAPLTLSGLVVGFNIERVPKLEAPPEEQALAGVRVAEINLTPRLVAKLLTQSYASQVDIFVTPDYDWLGDNSAYLGEDPDFVQFNPEFELLAAVNRRTFGGLQLPAGNSDAARQVWQWIFADPEARAFMNGEPDPWGMVVNPVYAANPEANPSGVGFGSPLPESFPKADPYCYVAPPRGPGGAPGDSVVPSALCGTDWMPYTRGFADGARITRDASDGARVAMNDTAQFSNEFWRTTPPQYSSFRSIMSLTDTASAAQFGLQVARLSRAGDNGPDRAFVAPTSETLRAGLATMKPDGDERVLETAPAGALAVDTARGVPSYPLSTLTYGAITPLTLEAAARSDYAAFLDYSSTTGQVPGFALGNLPPGYVPLPDDLRAQTNAAAVSVRTLKPVAVVDPTPTTTTTSVPTTSPPPPTTPFLPTGNPTSNFPGSVFVPTSPGGGTATDPVSQTTVAAPAEPPPPTTAVETTVVPVGDEPIEERPSILTPLLAVGRSRYAVPALGVVAVASALGALEITKRPRRRELGEGFMDPPGELGAGGVA